MQEQFLTIGAESHRIYRFIANKRYNPLPARQGALRPRVILRTFRKGLH